MNRRSLLSRALACLGLGAVPAVAHEWPPILKTVEVKPELEPERFVFLIDPRTGDTSYYRIKADSNEMERGWPLDVYCERKFKGDTVRP